MVRECATTRHPLTDGTGCRRAPPSRRRRPPSRSRRAAATRRAASPSAAELPAGRPRPPPRDRRSDRPLARAGRSRVRRPGCRRVRSPPGRTRRAGAPATPNGPRTASTGDVAESPTSAGLATVARRCPPHERPSDRRSGRATRSRAHAGAVIRLAPDRAAARAIATGVLAVDRIAAARRPVGLAGGAASVSRGRASHGRALGLARIDERAAPSPLPASFPPPSRDRTEPVTPVPSGDVPHRPRPRRDPETRTAPCPHRGRSCPRRRWNEPAGGRRRGPRVERGGRSR